MAEYGVNLVQEHSRWDNIFQLLTGKITLEVCAAGVCKEKHFELTAKDAVEWGVKIASLMASLAKDVSVPIGNGGGDPPEGYTPTYSGAMPREAILYVPDGDPAHPDEYVYVPSAPMDTIEIP